MKLNRLATGVLGLDDMLYGGVPQGNQVMICGEAGTGKTLLTFEIAYRNAKLNIPTTYVTLEEGKVNLLENVSSAFSYFDDILELEEGNILQVTEREILDAFKSTENWDAFIVGINKAVKANKSQLLILDSITPLRPLAQDDRVFTRYINSMVENFRNLGVTSFITLEESMAGPGQPAQHSGIQGTYMFDGIIKLNTLTIESSFQYLMTIVKMRKTNHRNAAMPYEITSKGFNVFK